MVHDESFLAHYSAFAGKPLCPATFGMHSAQVNVGKTGFANTAVDKWHFDSVDYVVVVILSDLEGMVGGELEVLRLNLGGKEATLKLQETGIPLEHVESHSYQTTGHGIFAQGSKIMHRVTPVIEAKEDRLSLILSFTTTDVFAQDNTRSVKFSKDPENIASWEMAKHAAWRVRG